MNEALNALAHGLRRITTFSGRDGRNLFWLYALFVIGAIFLVFQILAAFVIMPIMSVQMSWDAATPPAGMEALSDYQKMFDVILTATIIAAGVIIVLMAAAIARRLRDAGVSPWLGLIPLPFLVTGLVLIVPMANGMLTEDPQDFDMTGFGLLFLNNLLYLLSLGLLVAGLCLKSKPA